ncbi:MAG: phage holin family protein [Sulfuritalea sp.]|nr:phage holin family protein [Sulfuritalea sp.]
MGDGAGKMPDQRGLFASTKGLLGTGVTLLHNRLELLGVELAEERLRLVSLLAYGGAAFLCIAAGLIFLAIFLTVLLWESNRLLALGVFSALFLGAGVASLMLAMSLARPGSKLFSASLAELRRDRDALANNDTTRPL